MQGSHRLGRFSLVLLLTTSVHAQVRCGDHFRDKTFDHLQRLNPLAYGGLNETFFGVEKIYEKPPKPPQGKFRTFVSKIKYFFEKLDETEIFPAPERVARTFVVKVPPTEVVFAKGSTFESGEAGPSRRSRRTEVDSVFTLSEDGRSWVETHITRSIADEMLRSEARFLNSFPFEGLVKFHELKEWRGRPALVTQYVEGKTLAQKLSEKEDVSVRAILYLVHALIKKRSRFRGFYHGNITPENIIFHAEQKATLIDPAYRSIDGRMHSFTRLYNPLLLRGERADGFAFGAILYEILTGHQLPRKMERFANPRIQDDPVLWKEMADSIKFVSISPASPKEQRHAQYYEIAISALTSFKYSLRDLEESLEEALANKESSSN